MKITRKMIDSEIYWKGRFVDRYPMRNEADFRRNTRRNYRLTHGLKSKKMKCDYFEIEKQDGKKLRICVYSPLEKMNNLPGILWTHGGGYAAGTPEGEIEIYERLMQWSPCVIASPEYRLSVEAIYPAAVEDSYQALLWLCKNTAEYGVKNSQIFLGGGSAGGGLCAALALMARDRRDVNIAFQMPLYPMIDNTMSTASMKDNNCISWNEKRSDIAWRMYLGGDYKSPQVSKYAAPLRETDYTNLPPAYSYVGTCDPFYDETIAYMEHLKSAGVEAEYKIFKGGYHAFEWNSPESMLGKAALQGLKEAYVYAVQHYFAEQRN